MERRSRASSAPQQHARQPRAARAAGTEFRSGLGRHSDPALGTIALIPWRTSFPSSKVRLYKPQASKPGVFFGSNALNRRAFPRRVTIPPPAQVRRAVCIRRISMRAWMGALLAAAVVALSGCGYNALQKQDEAVKAAWSEVVNQYQRRADLIPNLVNTVKGYAAQEQKVLIGVTEARARASSIQVTPEVLNNPQLFQKYQAAQGDLTQALKSLMVVVENYPQLKSDQNFRDLQSQLEGTENRITVARNRYIKSVQEFNTTVRSFPTNLTAMLFKMDVKPNFSVENEKALSVPPKVDFGKQP